jgi:hypothetical protein
MQTCGTLGVLGFVFYVLRIERWQWFAMASRIPRLGAMGGIFVCMQTNLSKYMPAEVAAK